MLQVTKDFDYETQCLIREMERVKSEIAILDKQKADLVSNQKEFDRLYEENEELKKSNSDLE
jgi:cell division protein FtsB